MIKTPVKHLGRTVVFSLLIILASINSGFSQSRNDWRTYGLKGQPRMVKEYDIFYPTKTHPIHQKKLSGILIFDSQGKLIEQIGFSFQGDNSYYIRSVNTFDIQGRKVLWETYRSVPTKAENLLLPDILETGETKLNSNLKEIMTSKLVRQFYADGKLSDETFYEGNGEIASDSHYTYPQKNETNIIITRNGKPDSVEKLIYKNKGRQMEHTTYRNGKPEYKSIHQLDKKGRSTFIQQFRVKMDSDGVNPIETYHFKSQRLFSGNNLKTETFSFDEKGSLLSRNLFWQTNNLQLKQKFYKFQPDQSKWVLNYQTKTNYQFDKQGSWTKFIRFKKETSKGKFFEEFAKERIINYH